MAARGLLWSCPTSDHPDTRVDPGNVFIPFHYREAAANLLTNDTLDPTAKIPEFKYCAVRLKRA